MTGSDACGAAPLLSPTFPSPKGPVAFSPSPLEPRQSLVSRDSSLEDLGLWDFGNGGRYGQAWPTPIPGESSGQGARSVCSAGPGPWPGWTWTEGPSQGLPHHLEAEELARATEGSAPGPPITSCHLGRCRWLSFCSSLWSPLLPTVTPPGLSGQQAASSELRDNSLL